MVYGGNRSGRTRTVKSQKQSAGSAGATSTVVDDVAQSPLLALAVPDSNWAPTLSVRRKNRGNCSAYSRKAPSWGSAARNEPDTRSSCYQTLPMAGVRPEFVSSPKRDGHARDSLLCPRTALPTWHNVKSSQKNAFLEKHIIYQVAKRNSHTVIYFMFREQALTGIKSRKSTLGSHHFPATGMTGVHLPL